jgi:hypothetical protein
MGCPRVITYKALEVLMDYPVPTNAAPLKIALSALALVKSYIAFVEKMFEELEEADELSLGLNDFLAQSANNLKVTRTSSTTRQNGDGRMRKILHRLANLFNDHCCCCCKCCSCADCACCA